MLRLKRQESRLRSAADTSIREEPAREGARCNLAPGSARGIGSAQVPGGRGGGRYKARGIIAAGLSHGPTRPCTRTLRFTSTLSSRRGTDIHFSIAQLVHAFTRTSREPRVTWEWQRSPSAAWRIISISSVDSIRQLRFRWSLAN